MQYPLQIFGVPLAQIGNREQLNATLEQMLDGDTTHMVVTPNPEILLIAREHKPYAAVLRAADLVVPDGFGVQLIALFRYGRTVFRHAGIDIGQDLLRLAHARHLPVLFLGGRHGSAISAAERLTKKHSDLRIYASADNVEVSEAGDVPDPKEEKRIRDAVLQTKPGIVFVGLGAPKQEAWMLRHKDLFPSVRVMIGVGGAFDIWSGRLPRAPRILRRLGFEWAWRFLLEPWRLRRLARAVFVFPILALLEKKSGHAL